MIRLEYFGERLARLRIAKGVTCRKMSCDLGRQPGYINQIENARGRRKPTYPSTPMIYEICEYLGITVDEFFRGEETNPVIDQKAGRFSNEFQMALSNLLDAVEEEAISRQQEKKQD